MRTKAAPTPQTQRLSGLPGARRLRALGRNGSRREGPRRELVPAVVLALFLGVMFVPLFSGTGSISALREDVVELRQAYNRAGMLTLQYRLAQYHNGNSFTAGTYLQELPEIDRRLWQVGRFFSDMQTELDEIETTIQVIHHAGAWQNYGSDGAAGEWTAEDLENWTITLQELDLRFGALLERLSDIESARNRAYNSIGLFGILLAILFVVLYLRQTTKLELAAHDQASQRRMALLTNKVQEDERRALARDLHDGTAQELAIARMAVDRLQDDAVRRTIEKSLARAIDEIRFLARRMRPMPENYDTPAEMIRELCEYFESRYSIEFAFDLDRRLKLNWPEDAVVHLYRIVQESLSNIVRHADASRVDVHLRGLDGAHSLDGARVELIIQDNGVGLHGAEDGFGTQGMRERAELLCAGFSRHSPPEGGTRVRLEFPIELEHCSQQ